MVVHSLKASAVSRKMNDIVPSINGTTMAINPSQVQISVDARKKGVLEIKNTVLKGYERQNALIAIKE